LNNKFHVVGHQHISECGVDAIS